MLWIPENLHHDDYLVALGRCMVEWDYMFESMIELIDHSILQSLSDSAQITIIAQEKAETKSKYERDLTVKIYDCNRLIWLNIIEIKILGREYLPNQLIVYSSNIFKDSAEAENIRLVSITSKQISDSRIKSITLEDVYQIVSLCDPSDQCCTKFAHLIDARLLRKRLG